MLSILRDRVKGSSGAPCLKVEVRTHATELQPHPAWANLGATGRQKTYEQRLLAGTLGAALDAESVTTTGRAVLARARVLSSGAGGPELFIGSPADRVRAETSVSPV